MGKLKESQDNHLPFIFILRLSHLKCIAHVLSQVNYEIAIHGFLCLFRIGYKFTNEVFAFFDYFKVKAVEVNVNEFIHANQRLFFNFIVVFVKTNKLTVLV